MFDAPDASKMTTPSFLAVEQCADATGIFVLGSESDFQIGLQLQCRLNTLSPSRCDARPLSTATTG